MTSYQDGPAKVMTALLARRDQRGSYVADLAKGIRSDTEFAAWPYIIPNIPESTPRLQRDGLTRALALCASRPNQKHVPGLRLGAALGRLAYATDGTWPGHATDPASSGIGQRLLTLPLLPLEEAAQVIDAVLGHAAHKGIGVDFHNVAKTLMYWESHDIDRDIEHRNALVFDFYSTSSRARLNNTNGEN